MLAMGDYRTTEYRFAWHHLQAASSILDVACGTGTFCSLAPDRIVGIDINPENVEYCRKRGINAVPGSALDLPFESSSFDAVHCSHLLQVFLPDDAVSCISELARVTKPGGKIVITTLNDFRRFFRHPENVRPYPPDALFRLFAKAKGASSPMWQGIPPLQPTDIGLRRPPLIELEFPTSPNLDRIGGALNGLQYGWGIRKYWTFNAYSLVLVKSTAGPSE
jgi:SAM-dependent methyltransferase